MTKHGQSLPQAQKQRPQETEKQRPADEKLLFDPWDLFLWGMIILFVGLSVGWILGIVAAHAR